MTIYILAVIIILCCGVIALGAWGVHESTKTIKEADKRIDSFNEWIGEVHMRVLKKYEETKDIPLEELERELE